ncbi:MAG: aminoacyl-tRNA hydrolase [Rhodospirillales bacterium]|nr:aminoacyl-tRNA hydrolase [Rhodospirillales bacterium]
MLLLVGLGNPGPKYENNRHNVGFMAVDALHDRYGKGPYRSKFGGHLAEAEIGGEKVHLFKPATYMNASGRAVRGVTRFFKIKNRDVTVLYDELDLVSGKIRVKRGGGAAGHNGIRSISANIGPEFRRVRIGIGHPGDKDRVTGHVLGNFTRADRGWLNDMLMAIVQAAPVLVEGDDARFMSDVALITNPPREKSKPGGEKTAKEKD